MDGKVTDKTYVLGTEIPLPVQEVGYHDFRVHQGVETARTQNFQTLHVVIGGEGVYNIGGKTFALKRGDVFFAPKGVLFSYYPSKDKPWRYLWFVLRGTEAEGALRSVGLGIPDEFNNVGYTATLKDFDEVENALSKLIMRTAEGAVPYEAGSAYYSVLSAVAASRRARSAPVNLAEYYVSKAEGLMEANFKRAEFGVITLSRIMNISHSYLSRIFRRVTGQTMSDRLIGLRYAYAARLLTTTPMTVREVSHNCGVGDEIHFYKKFKQIFGMTAGEYRASGS